MKVSFEFKVSVLHDSNFRTVLDAWAKRGTPLTSESIGDTTGSPWCLKVNVNDIVNEISPPDIAGKTELKSRKVQFKGRFCVVKIGLPRDVTISRDNLTDTDPTQALHLNVSGSDLSSTIYEYWANRIDYFNKETFYFSTCFPSKCSYRDISNIVSLISRNDTQLDASLTRYCNSVDEEKTKLPPWRATFSLAVIILLAVVVIVCTVINQVIKNVTPGDEEDKKTFERIDNFTKHFNLIIAHDKLLTPLEAPAAQRMRSMDFYITIVQV